MQLRRLALPLLVLGTMLMGAAPAHASTPAPSPLTTNLQARATFCVPCGIYAATLAVRIAQGIRVARAARALRAAATVLKTAPRGVAITSTRLTVLRTQASTIARRGRVWTKRNWTKQKPYVRACIAGVAALETTDVLKDGKMTKSEWHAFISGQNLGNTDTSYLALYQHPAFDFGVPKDTWFAACAVGIVTKGVAG